MKKVRVLCSYEVEVYYNDEDDDSFIHFCIEDNGCPGTSRVGLALDEAIEFHDKQSTCWACALQGKNKILSIIKQ